MIKGKRLVAWFLTVLMVMQMMPTNVLAEAANEWRLSTLSVEEGGKTYYVVNFVKPDGSVVGAQLVESGKNAEPPQGDYWDAANYTNIKKDTTVYPKDIQKVEGKAIVGVYLNEKFVKVREATITTTTEWWGRTTTVNMEEVRGFTYGNENTNFTNAGWRYGTNTGNINTTLSSEGTISNYNNKNTYYIAPYGGWRNPNAYKFYTVTIVCTDADTGEQIVDTQIVRHDQNARLKEEAGYDYTIKGSLTNVQSARTVEVTRKARPTATFMNDGVEYASIRAHDRNGNVNAPETNPMKQGYVFKGWSITPDGTAISFPTRITTDTTFYAVWAEAKTVAYLNEDGSAFATFSVEADTQAPVPSGNPEPAEGYAFAGWAKQGTQTVVDPATYTVNDNLTFVPVWVEVATVTFKNGNETEKEVTVVIGSKVSAADVPSLATTDTQAFKGWSLSENGPVVTVTDEVITANTTFYAVWAELATVTFKSGDTVAKTVKVEKGNKLSSADVPTLPAQEGSLFQGWLDAERRAG